MHFIKKTLITPNFLEGARSTMINNHSAKVDNYLSMTAPSRNIINKLYTKNYFILNNKIYDIDILKMFLESDKRRVHYHQNISLLDAK